MAEKVDNPGARQQVRQTQPTQKPQQVSRNAGKMGIGNRPTARPDFGQLLQDTMRYSSPIRHEPAPYLPRQKARESNTYKSESHRAQEQNTNRPATDSAVREAHRQRDSRDSSDSRESRRGSESRDSTQHAKEAEQRVVGREGRGESQGRDSGKEGRQGTGGERGQQSQPGSTKSAAQTAKSTAKAMQAHALFAGKGQQASRLAGKGLLPPRLPQELLDRIVKHARLLMNKDGEKEMQLALHEEIFKGLRLRIATKKGKVTATFVTSSREVHDLFLSERRAIDDALTEKGVEVEGIDVIMT